MNPLKKGQLREEGRYMWRSALHPHLHIYLSSRLLAFIFSALTNLIFVEIRDLWLGSV